MRNAIRRRLNCSTSRESRSSHGTPVCIPPLSRFAESSRAPQHHSLAISSHNSYPTDEACNEGP
ncbi:hypothetical protein N431DRAFT_430036 [Stipitochalara longipes BDJ]|nr:hypothetical protein N431DRAFT_430036 [Stipitochalara longipes BDJ]